MKNLTSFVRRSFRLRHCIRSNRHFSSLDSIENKNAAAGKESKLKDLLDDSALGAGPLDEVDEEDEWRTTPYPVGAVVNARQSQSLKSLRPKVDPSETSIILFPGQGSQYVGMGRELLKFPGARDIFEAANSILNYDILKLMLNGPKNQLDQTKYCQPAVVVCSLAALEKLKEERPSAIETCMATAGFSVGEITALTFAGVFKFGDAIKLVRARAEAMQLASEMAPGGMATVIYSPNSQLQKAMVKAREWCLERGINEPECRIATYLNPTMKVVAGHTEALRYLECNKKFYKLNDVKRLPVQGAFHSNLMFPATLEFRKKLYKLEPSDPQIVVHSNVNGEYYRNKEHVIQQLPKQICKPIKWEQMLHILYEREPDCNFPETIVCGPNNPLKEYLKGVNAKAAEFCALKFLSDHQKEFKLRKVIRVPVSGAFHTNLMLPAVDTFRQVLDTVEMHEPTTSIYTNVEGRRYRNLKDIKKKLPAQICRPVLWEQMIHNIFGRSSGTEFPSSFVCGPKPGSVRNMIDQITSKASKYCVLVE